MFFDGQIMLLKCNKIINVFTQIMKKQTIQKKIKKSEKCEYCLQNKAIMGRFQGAEQIATLFIINKNPI